MKKLLPILLFTILLPSMIQAQTLNEFQWQNRVLILFTPEPDNHLFQEQYVLLEQVTNELLDRQVKVIFVESTGSLENTGLFANKSRTQYYYNLFNVEHFQFEMLLIGLDGNVKLRARNKVTGPEKIFELIDAMPMRRRELMSKSQPTGSENTRAGKSAVRY